jgi:hypothetical protein
MDAVPVETGDSVVLEGSPGAVPLAGSGVVAVTSGVVIGCSGAEGGGVTMVASGSGSAVGLGSCVDRGVGMAVSVGPGVGAGAGTAVVGSGASVGPGVGTGAGTNVAGIGVFVGGVRVPAEGGSGVGAGVSPGVAPGSGVGASSGGGVSTGSGPNGWLAVGAGLLLTVGLDVAAGDGTIPSQLWTAMAAGSTRTTTRSLVESALAALIVAVFVQVPGALARNITSLTPLAPGSSVPIVSVKPLGVKHPPLTTSVSTTPVAGTAPLLP